MPPAPRNRQRGQPSNIDVMKDLENAMPFELAWPSANSSAAISLTSAYRCLLSGG